MEGDEEEEYDGVGDEEEEDGIVAAPEQHKDRTGETSAVGLSTPVPPHISRVPAVLRATGHVL